MLIESHEVHDEALRTTQEHIDTAIASRPTLSRTDGRSARSLKIVGSSSRNVTLWDRKRSCQVADHKPENRLLCAVGHSPEGKAGSRSIHMKHFKLGLAKLQRDIRAQDVDVRTSAYQRWGEIC